MISPVDAIKRIAAEEDVDRLRTATTIINAVTVHLERVGRRKEWLPCDLQKLGQMLALADSIGPEPAFVENYAKDYGRAGIAAVKQALEVSEAEG